MANILPIKRDGNCLFRALAHQINNLMGLTFDHMAVRRDLANYVAMNRDNERIHLALLNNIQDFLPNNNLPQEQKITKYITAQFKETFWGGEDILIAASEFYVVNVYVHMKNENTLVYSPTGEAVPGNVHILYNEQHYDSWVLMDDEQDSSNQQTTLPQEPTNANIQENQKPLRKSRRQKSKLQLPRPLTPQTPRETSASVQNTPLSNEVADVTGYTLLRNPPSAAIKYTCPVLGIATWNVRGASKPHKKATIDAELSHRGIHVACLQETGMNSGRYNSAHYEWHLSGTAGKTNRGLAILIRHDAQIRISNLKKDSDVMSATLSVGMGSDNQAPLYIINTHINSCTHKATRSFTGLLNLIRQKPKKCKLVILGDFNAHIGRKDTQSYQRKGLIHQNLHHEDSNYNGEMLMDIANREKLQLETTKARTSCRITWSKGTQKSQLDHIITPQATGKLFQVIKGEWATRGVSDHKIIWGLLRTSRIAYNNESNKHSAQRQTQGAKEAILEVKDFNYKQCYYAALNSQSTKTKYHESIEKKLVNIGINPTDANVEIPWNNITGLLKAAAQETLIFQPQHARDHRLALAKLQKAKFLQRRQPDNPHRHNHVKECQATLLKVKYQEEQKACRAFFNGLGKKHPSKRMQILYQFYRSNNQQAKRRKRNVYIPMSKWEQILKSSEGPPIPTANVTKSLTEEQSVGPTTDEVTEIINNMRNGTAPGTDQVVIELYKAMPPILQEAVTKHMKKAWTQNEAPDTWSETVQVPIPKNSNPKDTNDYRRISICNTGYRIYASYLLKKLDETIKELGNYQAAFLSNRSTDDHIFTLKRVLDEEWRAGKRIYVLALDIEKAFDNIDLNVLRDILIQRTNKPLANRITRICMNERTHIKWCGQQSNWIIKGKGVKQGCPLSPRLFTLVMDDVLRTLEDETQLIKLDQDHEISLPLVLSFADDLIFITDDLEGLEGIVYHIKPLLASVGLHINETKTKILIRDPIASQKTTHVTINGITLSTVDEIKYLGTFITSTLSRKSTIKKRCEQATRNSKALLQFMTYSKMEWKLARLMYQMVIVPCMIHGLKVSALTKANRSRLRRYERVIMRDLINHAKNKPRQKKIHEILNGKTVTKRIKNHRLCYLAHVHRRRKPHLLHAAMQYKAKSKKVGRPIYTWNDNLKQDMAYFDKEINFWRDTAEERDKIKKAADEIYKKPETDSDTSDEDTGTTQQSRHRQRRR